MTYNVSSGTLNSTIPYQQGDIGSSISLPRLSMCACVCVEHWPGYARCRSHESSLLPGRVAVGYNRGQVVCWAWNVVLSVEIWDSPVTCGMDDTAVIMRLSVCISTLPCNSLVYSALEAKAIWHYTSMCKFCHAMLCKLGLCRHAVSICMYVYVCLSVCPWRSWILSKRINISSKFFHHRVAKPF